MFIKVNTAECMLLNFVQNWVVLVSNLRRRKLGIIGLALEIMDR